MPGSGSSADTAGRSRTGAGLEAALIRLADIQSGLDGIIFLHTLTASTALAVADDLERVYAALALARGMASSPRRPRFCQFVTAQGGGLGLDGAWQPLAPAFEALCHPLAAELPDVTFESLDVSPDDAPAVTAELILASLECLPSVGSRASGRTSTGEVQLALRALADLPVGRTEVRPGTVVVFAGGARGIGAVCARRLAAETACRLVFFGRTPLTDEAHALARLPAVARQFEMQRFVRDYRAEHPGAPPRAGRDAWRIRSRRPKYSTP